MIGRNSRRPARERVAISGARLGALALVILGLLVIAGAFVYRLDEEVSEPSAAPIPGSLAGVELTSAKFGAEALAEVNQLHGRSFTLTSGGVGMYGGDGQITLWVTGAPARFLATRLLEQMRREIAGADTPFDLIGEREILGRKIYELEGMGKRHYTFQSHRLVIWLAADPSLADQALRDVLEFYP